MKMNKKNSREYQKDLAYIPDTSLMNSESGFSAPDV